jgi:outer membrane protein assembly factor BamB
VPLGTATRAPSALAHVPADPTLGWEHSLGRAASGPPVYGNAVIVALAMDRYLTVLDAETGRRVWRKRLSTPGAGGPLFDGERVYAATSGHLGRVYGYDLRGHRLWQQKIPNVSAPLALVGDHVIVPTETGEVLSLRATTGDLLWRRRLPQPARSGAAPTDSSVLIATDDSLFRLRAADGAIEAQVGLPGTMLAPAAIDGDTLVVTTGRGEVLALHAGTLDPLWSVATGAAIFGGAAIARDTVFTATVHGDVWSIPLRDPASARHTSLNVPIRAPVSPTLDGVLIGTVAGEIVLVGAGGPRTIVDSLAGPIEQLVLVQDGRMITIDGDGRMQAWR